ncbi:MAG: putative porin [Bacteroidales bacterium]|nr:putative porin [Bacteroidales bacterium]MCM1147410.1 putative porin [Bacteroidales bacterium]MCM1206079.1 putative porin [Bacillota bacterium]MCM1510090.1 putative porin [Clostridium sp.]
MGKIFITVFLLFCVATARAQFDDTILSDDGTIVDPDGTILSGRRDSTNQHKKIPKGLYVWTVDNVSGDIYHAHPDTTSYLRMNHVFASGIHGEYQTLGNNGSPRISRIFIDRNEDEEFLFTHGWSQVIVQPQDFHFTNTLSPITNFEYNQCGNKTNGEDHLKSLFAVNAGKKLGLGFKFDYLYARGYYQNQSTSHFDYTMWGSYHDDRYQAHLLMSTNHHKQAENGGIQDDNYIKHPEMFTESLSENEIPTILSNNWNRHDNQHIFFTHRYSLGFRHRVPMTEQEIEARKFAIAAAKEKEINELKAKEDAGASEIMEEKPQEEEDFTKEEYVPVTSFFHTAQFDNYRRTYLAYDSPEGYYKDDFYNLTTDSINDRYKYSHLRNTFGISLLEGFNKYAKAGLKVFAISELKHYSNPISQYESYSWNEHNFIIGGQLSKHQGKTLHFDVMGEVCIAGNDAGQFHIDAEADVNFPLFGDTIQLDAKGSFAFNSANTYLEKFASRHFQWNESFDNETRTHIEGNFSLQRTQTRFRFAVDNITNYTYLGTSYTLGDNNSHIATSVTPHQAESVQVITAQLCQNLNVGILHFDNVLTFQKSSDDMVLPLPKFNVYSTLYLRFKIAKVLATDFGVDMRYFTKYYAPEYVPQLQSFAIQENTDIRTEVGNYPICNVYANFQLKQCRFFVMMSHVNCSGKGNYFLTPHNPLNGRVFRFGLNWTFNN